MKNCELCNQPSDDLIYCAWCQLLCCPNCRAERPGDACKNCGYASAK